MTKVLVIPAGTMVAASSRYRVYQYLEPLRDAGFQITVLNYPGLPTRTRRLVYFSRLALLALSADIVLIQKRLFPRFFPLLHRLNPRIVYDFDDALFAHSPVHQPAGMKAAYYEAEGRCFDAVLAVCRHVIAGNEYLASYARHITPNVSIIPTAVDLSRYHVRTSRPSPDAPIVLGWVGSGHNLIYLEDLAPVFAMLSQHFWKKILLHVISDRPPNLPASIPLRFQPWCLESEIEDLLAFDIGLMPLRDDDWTRGKCAFKAIQYMAIGIPVLASPVGANVQLISHNVNGLLAATEEQWLESLTALVQDSELRCSLGRAGRRTVERRYSSQLMIPQLTDVFRQVLES